jgi:hypothetical protein
MCSASFYACDAGRWDTYPNFVELLRKKRKKKACDNRKHHAAADRKESWDIWSTSSLCDAIKRNKTDDRFNFDCTEQWYIFRCSSPRHVDFFLFFFMWHTYILKDRSRGLSFFSSKLVCVLLYTRWTLLRVHKYSSVNSMSSTVLPDPHDPTRLAVSGTRLNKAMLSTVCVCAAEAASDLFLRAPLMVRKKWVGFWKSKLCYYELWMDPNVLYNRQADQPGC